MRLMMLLMTGAALMGGLTTQGMFDENLITVLDVVDWKDNRAMNGSRIQVLNSDGAVIASYQNPRFKFSGAAAFTPNCVWIGMAGFNPYAKAEPDLPLSIHQSVACIDRKTGQATDFFVDGMAAEVPTSTQSGQGVIFGSSSKPLLILARDNKSIKVLDLTTIDPKIDVALKTRGNYAHINGFYYQQVEMGVGNAAIIKIDERTLEPRGIVRLRNAFTPAVVALGGSLIALQTTDRSVATALLLLDADLNIKQKITKDLKCFDRSLVLGTHKNRVYGVNVETHELFAYDFKRCQVVTKVPASPFWGALKKDLIYFYLGDGQRKIPVYDLRTDMWKSIDAGQSIDWVQ
jgi:hypothetical protein